MRARAGPSSRRRRAAGRSSTACPRQPRSRSCVRATPRTGEARDSALAAALAAIDTLAARVMKIQLEHALAADTSLGAPTRRVFAQTVVSYSGNLSLLAQRARDVAGRGGAAQPDDIAAQVVD